MKKGRGVSAGKTGRMTTKRHHPLPSAPAHELLTAIRNLAEFYPAHQMIQNSYVLSRFWAWFSQVRLSPKMRVPVPRFLTVRDP